MMTTLLLLSLLAQEPAKFYGWKGPEAAAAASRDNPPTPFRLVGPIGNSAKVNARLWWGTTSVNAGKHLSTHRQEIGDCVSQGWATAIDYHVACSIAFGFARAKLRRAYQPHIYWSSRVKVGRGRLRGEDGSLGSWAAKGVDQWGYLFADATGVPVYSGVVAREWGDNDPPKDFISLAKDYRVRSGLVRSYTEARDAIASGYPVAVCSSQGFEQLERSGGKVWGKPVGVWHHCMCFIGVDDKSARPGVYCLNSWGPDAHGKPLGGEPPGGFWIDAKVAQRMLAEGDSYAVTDAKGFIAQKIDWTLWEGQAK
jgi:hypothetical protein